MKHILLIIFIVLLSSCSEQVRETIDTKKQDTTVRKLDNSYDISGKVTLPTLGEVPVNFKIKQKESERTQTIEEFKSEKESEKDTTSPVAESGFSLLTSLVALLLGGGTGGIVMNILKNGTISRIVQGISNYKEKAPEALDALHGALRGTLKESDKRLIKKLKK